MSDVEDGVDSKREREIHQCRTGEGTLERAAIDRQKNAILLTEQQQEYLFREGQRGDDHVSRCCVAESGHGRP